MLTALSFLTPLGGARPPSSRATAWFPVVGALVGALAGAAWWAAQEVWSPAVAAAVVVVVDLALTGMLHLDGLGDAADGLLPHLDRERRLEVMAQPDLGAFGVGVVASVLLLRWAALASLDADPLLLAGLWAASRSLMAIALATGPPARPGGLSAAFQGGPWWPPMVAVLLVAVAFHDVPRGVALGVGLAAGAGVVALANRRIGGYTGDVLGAAGMVLETVGLVVASARW